MSRALAHRLTRLEQQARARDLPTWHEGYAAAARLRAHAVATLKALLHHQVGHHARWRGDAGACGPLPC